jgi:hypothetical protein
LVDVDMGVHASWGDIGTLGIDHLGTRLDQE